VGLPPRNQLGPLSRRPSANTATPLASLPLSHPPSVMCV
jgi:hypothetical protein